MTNVIECSDISPCTFFLCISYIAYCSMDLKVSISQNQLLWHDFVLYWYHWANACIELQNVKSLEIMMKVKSFYLHIISLSSFFFSFSSFKITWLVHVLFIIKHKPNILDMISDVLHEYPVNGTFIWSQFKINPCAAEIGIWCHQLYGC